MKVVIIGGVAGGASAAARLRRLNEKAEIILFERGEFISFANCGLPYYIGGDIADKKLLTLQTPQSFKARFNIDVRVNTEVIEICPKSSAVTVRDLSDNTTYLMEYDMLILSPGAEPIKPPINGIDSAGVFTLRNIPDTMKIKSYIDDKHPKSAVVVGGGYIGVEMAENLHNAGLNVSIVELSDHLIAPLDFDMAVDVQKYLADNGVDVIVNNGITSISSDNSSIAKTISLQNGTITADMIIMAVGVRPETSLAKNCGINLNHNGFIITDSSMRTNIKNIYAVGDAIQIENFVSKQPGSISLAGPANKQGRIAADNICGYDSRYTGTQGSAVAKIFQMTVATTGLNEKALKNANIDYDKTYIYSPSHASYYPDAQNMSIKVLWEKETSLLLGAQIVGFDGVDKRMDVLACAIRFHAKVTDLITLELCYAPPFSSAKDPVNMIGFVAENVISGKMNQFFWDEVDSLPRDGSVFLLDVRTDAEVVQGKIDGFTHIPLDSLRENLHLIPKDKQIFIHCHSGLRSYIACRLLYGYGYKCHNLAGGYRLYKSVVNCQSVRDFICTECEKK